MRDSERMLIRTCLSNGFEFHQKKDGIVLIDGEEITMREFEGLIEEVETALNDYDRFTRQTLDNLSNPLEPLKVYSALKSEILKYEIRNAKDPKSVSPLDITIMFALKRVLEEVSE